MVDATRALARLGRFASHDAIPMAQLGLSRLRWAADELTIRMLGRDFEERLRRVPVQGGEGHVDPFGLDLETAKYAIAASAFLHRVYFRTEVHGIARLPPGRVLLISNHSGQVPIDAVLIAAATFLDGDPPRLVRAMVEKWTQTLPFIGTFFQRVGQVVGVPENARRLLSLGEAVLVFPEGAKGVSKPFRQRYRLVEFGLGFMRLALETRTPIVPVAVVGTEEQYVNLGNIERLAKTFRMPVFPVIPQWFIPGAQLPLPTKVRIYFGAPLHFDGDPDDEDAAVEERVLVVKRAVQGMIDAGLRERKSIFW